MDRKEILNKVDEIQNNNCLGCTKFAPGPKKNLFCKDYCNAGKEIVRLGDQLLKPKQDRVKELLNKGADLTFPEILWLLEQEVSKVIISKKLRVTHVTFNRYLERNKKVRAVWE